MCGRFTLTDPSARRLTQRFDLDGTFEIDERPRFNIAPTDADVWSVPYYEGRTHTSPAERAAFEAVVDAGFADVVRPHTSEPGTFTYWDYTQLRFARREGMRIDFSLCSPALAARVTGAEIDRQERKGKGASDHAPVIVEIA